MNRGLLVVVCAAAVLAAAVIGDGRSQSRDEILQKAGLSADARAAIITVGDDVRKLDKSHQAYVDAAQGLDALFVKLQQKVREVARLASEAEKPDASRRQKLLEAVREMAEMSQSFNIQYADVNGFAACGTQMYQLPESDVKTTWMS